MASGKKNYFRHSFFAGSDDKIVNLISERGKEAYFHYFRLLELCGQQAADSIPEKFVFHRRTLCSELLVTNSRLGHHLLAMQSSLLLHYVMTDRKVEIHIPNIAKYLGKYTAKLPSNTPNKRKEKKKKEKKSKEKILTCENEEIGIFKSMKKATLDEFCDTYGKENVYEEIRAAQIWTEENNRKHKSPSSFLRNWLKKSGLPKLNEKDPLLDFFEGVEKDAKQEFERESKKEVVNA